MRKFIAFNQEKWGNQDLPDEKKEVVLLVKSPDPAYPDGLHIGYLKYGAGDPNSPYFVIPGGNYGQGAPLQVLAWCDCLPKGFRYPTALSSKK